MDPQETNAFNWKEFSQRTWVVLVCGLVFPPLGIFLSWRKPEWTPKAKWITTGLMGLLLLWRMGGSEKKERPDLGSRTEATTELEKSGGDPLGTVTPSDPSAGNSNSTTNLSAAITDEQFNRVQLGVNKFVVEDTLGKPLSRDTELEQRGTVIVFTYRLISRPNKLARFVFRGKDTNPPLDEKDVISGDSTHQPAVTSPGKESSRQPEAPESNKPSSPWRTLSQGKAFPASQMTQIFEKAKQIKLRMTAKEALAVVGHPATKVERFDDTENFRPKTPAMAELARQMNLRAPEPFDVYKWISATDPDNSCVWVTVQCDEVMRITAESSGKPPYEVNAPQPWHFREPPSP